MKVYTFGDAEKPALLLLPGTCCHWESNFGQIIPLLASDFRVLCVSYDGFDETERTEFPTMLEKTAKIEDWIRANCGGHIRAAYGCSLGGSFVGLLAARGNIRMDFGILGGSDLITPLPDGIDVPGTEIHIFYALKMGEKYRARYLQHFARPVIHELDLQHEELLVRFPERWAALVREIITKGGTAR